MGGDRYLRYACCLFPAQFLGLVDQHVCAHCDVLCVGSYAMSVSRSSILIGRKYDKAFLTAFMHEMDTHRRKPGQKPHPPP